MMKYSYRYKKKVIHVCIKYKWSINLMKGLHVRTANYKCTRADWHFAISCLPQLTSDNPSRVTAQLGPYKLYRQIQ